MVTPTETLNEAAKTLDWAQKYTRKALQSDDSNAFNQSILEAIMCAQYALNHLRNVQFPPTEPKEPTE